MPFPDQPDQEFSEAGILQILAGQSGVYGIFNGARWIYIGKAHDLRERLLEHVRMQSAEAVCIYGERPTGWCAEFVPLAHLASREAALIRELRPRCNEQR